MRYIASAGASAVVLPLIQNVGIAATNAIAMVIALAGFALICVTIKYGKSWREARATPEAEEVQNSTGQGN